MKNTVFVTSKKMRMLSPCTTGSIRWRRYIPFTNRKGGILANQPSRKTHGREFMKHPAVFLQFLVGLFTTLANWFVRFSRVRDPQKQKQKTRLVHRYEYLPAFPHFSNCLNSRSYLVYSSRAITRGFILIGQFTPSLPLHCFHVLFVCSVQGATHVYSANGWVLLGKRKRKSRITIEETRTCSGAEQSLTTFTLKRLEL